jgi:hypothetical protein
VKDSVQVGPTTAVLSHGDDERTVRVEFERPIPYSISQDNIVRGALERLGRPIVQPTQFIAGGATTLVARFRHYELVDGITPIEAVKTALQQLDASLNRLRPAEFGPEAALL